MYELVETSREKTSNNQVVQTNGVNSMNAKERLTSSSSSSTSSSSSQPPVDKNLSDDKQQIVQQRSPKPALSSSPERYVK